MSSLTRHEPQGRHIQVCGDIDHRTTMGTCKLAELAT
jgi:hypothetical protein